MKFAIVMPIAEQRGGAELALEHLLRANRRAGPQEVEYVLAFLEEGPMVEVAAALGYRTRVFDAGRLRQVHRFVRTVVALAAWLKQERAQVVLSWMTKAHFYTAPATRLARSPAAWWQWHIPEGGWSDSLATRLPARMVFCCSKAGARAQQALSPPRPTRVVYPPVDLEHFDPERLPTPTEARSKLGLPGQGPLIGIFARFQRWKGLHVFLEAAARVLQVRSDARFVIAGGPHFSEPDYPTELHEQARRAGISDRIYFVGFQKEIPLWMQALDVVVNASTGPEPFGMTIIEALALGKAVIATRQGGPLEIINDGKDGVLVSPNDPAALASTILGLLAEDDLGALDGAARQRARQFGTDQFASKLARCLSEVAR